MKRFTTLFALILGTTVLNVNVGPAHACSVDFGYTPEVELFESGDFNQGGSEFDLEYAQRAYEHEPTPKVLGVYRVEVVGTVEPAVLSGPYLGLNPKEISRGSVATVTEYWGQAPGALAPYAAGFPEEWTRQPDTGGCEFLDYPPNDDMGEVWYRALTTDGTLEVAAEDSQASMEILDAGFGERTTVERDESGETTLLVTMQAEHDRILAASNRLSVITNVLAVSGLSIAGIIGAAYVRHRHNRKNPTEVNSP